MRKVLKGIRTLHPAQEKQARPFQLDQLRALVGWLDASIARATESANASLPRIDYGATYNALGHVADLFPALRQRRLPPVRSHRGFFMQSITVA